MGPCGNILAVDVRGKAPAQRGKHRARDYGGHHPSAGLSSIFSKCTPGSHEPVQAGSHSRFDSSPIDRADAPPSARHLVTASTPRAVTLSLFSWQVGRLRKFLQRFWVGNVRRRFEEWPKFQGGEINFH